jgi:hypothetical protein
MKDALLVSTLKGGDGSFNTREERIGKGNATQEGRQRSATTQLELRASIFSSSKTKTNALQPSAQPSEQSK